MHEFYLKSGDLLPIPIFQNDINLDLSQCTGVYFRYFNKYDTSQSFIKTGQVLSVLSGIVQYQWSGADTTSIGIYNGNWRLFMTGNYPINFPRDGYFTFAIAQQP